MRDGQMEFGIKSVEVPEQKKKRARVHDRKIITDRESVGRSRLAAVAARANRGWLAGRLH